MGRSMLLVLLLSSAVFAADPTGDIRFPTLVIPPSPKVEPPPEPAPPQVPVLEYGKFYVVQSETQFFIAASPRQSANVTYETGPLRLRGMFADGSGDIETRNYSSKFIAIIDASKGVSGKVELLAIPVGIKSENELVRTVVEVGKTPIPPPGPTPDKVDVKPHPPKPDVVVPTGLRVLFVYETSAKYPPEVTKILYSTAIVEYLNQRCVKGDDGRAEWRKWDKDVQIASTESKTMKALFEQAKSKLGEMPQLVIAVNGNAKVYDLPPTEQETLALLKKLGG